MSSPGAAAAQLPVQAFPKRHRNLLGWGAACPARHDWCCPAPSVSPLQRCKALVLGTPCPSLGAAQRLLVLTLG